MEPDATNPSVVDSYVTDDARRIIQEMLNRPAWQSAPRATPVTTPPAEFTASQHEALIRRWLERYEQSRRTVASTQVAYTQEPMPPVRPDAVVYVQFLRSVDGETFQDVRRTAVDVSLIEAWWEHRRPDVTVVVLKKPLGGDLLSGLWVLQPYEEVCQLIDAARRGIVVTPLPPRPAPPAPASGFRQLELGGA